MCQIHAPATASLGAGAGADGAGFDRVFDGLLLCSITDQNQTPGGQSVDSEEADVGFAKARNPELPSTAM